VHSDVCVCGRVCVCVCGCGCGVCCVACVAPASVPCRAPSCHALGACDPTNAITRMGAAQSCSTVMAPPHTASLHSNCTSAHPSRDGDRLSERAAGHQLAREQVGSATQPAGRLWTAPASNQAGCGAGTGSRACASTNTSVSCSHGAADFWAHSGARTAAMVRHSRANVAAGRRWAACAHCPASTQHYAQHARGVCARRIEQDGQWQAAHQPRCWGSPGAWIAGTRHPRARTPAACGPCYERGSDNSNCRAMFSKDGAPVLPTVSTTTYEASEPEWPGAP
jgi:hypothetical protein